MRRVAAQILRFALGHPEMARLLVAELRGRPEFQEHVRGKRFRNPDTGNKVLYESLPEKEQRRVYLEWWRGRRREQDSGRKDPAQLEETRERIERENPWAIPLWEYHDRVQEGAGKKYHAPGEIKTQTVESLSWMGEPKESDVKIGERDFGDTTVSFYRGTDRNKYTKTNEDGDIVRDPETGLATYLSEEEMLGRGLPLFGTTVRAYDGATPIGSVADEWGATLVQVAEEHQKKGIGKFLSKIWRKAFPFKTSGGFSDQGRSTFKRVYQDFVREALESGQYDRAMKEGWMSPRRFKDILDSAGLDPEGKEIGKPRVEKPDLGGSDEMREVRDDLAQAGRLMREMDWEETDYTDEQKAAHREKYKALLSRAMRLEEDEKERGDDEERRRDQEMSDLANSYWKAKQRGDAEEAKRVWDQMGAMA